ncbi:perilipin-2-like isoform X2 [Cottoperca gobio]|uniref:Perilipin-2-like isoform X2 n=1 Tax=Cottoperca gobio TaxID=56716 RepID=A0A6J2QAF6_COTGO|nr:perilipin-2-like isoform X2 [Cottoperca gobio]
MKQHFADVRNMPKNNNQKVLSAAARLAKVPIVYSVCTKLSVFYIDTKGGHPNLRSVCEVLESSVTAVVSPVMVKLEPQIFVANDVACRSLDWLERAFPLLHTPTEEIVANAKNKMHEIQDVVSIAVYGTIDCVEHTVAWLRAGIQQIDVQADQSRVEKAIKVASVGLDSALIMSEALVDRVLPPTEEDKKEEAHLVEGFEAAILWRRYPLRLVSLATKMCRRTYHMVGSRMQSVQAMENLSSVLFQDLQTKCLTVTWSIHVLPQYLQHQLVSVFFFINQMYNLGCPPPKQSHQDRSCLNATETPTRMVLVPSQVKPTCRMTPFKTPVFKNGCIAEGCLR